MYKEINKEIRKNKSNLKELIINTFTSIEERFGVSLTYKDMTNMSLIHPEFTETLRQFIPHSSEYCAYIKVDSLFLNCLSCQNRLRKKMINYKKPFYGSCYAGVEEYFYPVILHDKLVGIICIGVFCQNMEEGLKKVRKAAKQNGKKTRLCEESFKKAMRPPVKDVKGLLSQAGTLASLIAYFYDETLHLGGKSFEVFNPKGLLNNSFNSEILTTAICYIRAHYCENIYLDDIAQICHCNTNYLSNLFVDKLHISFTDYVNLSRVELSKELLLFTTLSVDEIAHQVGFQYPSYFIRIFKKNVGKTPHQFRKKV